MKSGVKNMLIAAAVSGAVTLIAIWTVEKWRGTGESVDVEPFPPPKETVFVLGEKMVNLQEPARYLRIGITLKVRMYGGPKGSDEQKEEGHRGPNGFNVRKAEGSGRGAEGVNARRRGAEVDEEQLDAMKPILLDRLVELASDSSFATLLKVSGKRSLKNSLTEAFDEELKSVNVEVANIYFHEFVMQ